MRPEVIREVIKQVLTPDETDVNFQIIDQIPYPMILVLNKSYVWTNKAATPIVYKDEEQEKFYEVSSDINKSDSEGSR